VSTSAEPAPLRGEIRALTGLRVVAALWVVAFHFQFTPGDAYTRYLEPLRPIVQSGALGVDMFYVLSGFVITLTYLDKMGPRPAVRRTVSFLWARICRIWPVYATVTTLFFVWLLYKSTRVTNGAVAYQNVQPELDLPHYVEQLLMVQLWHRPFFDGSSFVGPAWSISAEWLAYVAFAAVVLVVYRLRSLPASVSGVLGVIMMLPLALLTYQTGDPYYPYSWLLRIGAGFLAGALVCLAVRRVRRTERVQRWAAGVSVLALVEIAIGLWWGSWRGQGAGDFGGVVVLAFPVLVGALALTDRGPARLLAREAFVHGGRISYSLYLIHVPVFEIFWTFMGWYPAIGPGTALGSILIPHVLLLVLLLAHLSYRYLEEPARLWLRARDPGRLLSRRVRA
jgi:peptidoglycan/LPS O-acetylase OafA/YrhL